MLAATWKLDVSIIQNIASFQVAANKWDQESFGHIDRRKYTLMARIHGIERGNESSSMSAFSVMEKSLKQEFDEVLQQEESLWFQRSRSEWIFDGDRNRKYYHRITKSKHRRNMCNMIKLEDRQWCSTPSLIHEGVVRYFKGVFSSSPVTHWDIHNRFTPLTAMEMSEFTREVTDEESVKDGTTVDFWFDEWLDNVGFLIAHVIHGYHPSPMSIDSFVNNRGE
ncbi:hypothetical protein V6N13_005889 [Hibiscus sabdariffa]